MKKFINCILIASVTLSATSCDWIQSLKAKAEETHEKVEETKARLRKEKKPETVVVRVMTAGPSEGMGMSAYVGQVEASRAATVTSPAVGTLVSLNVREGQAVAKGQVVARVESQTLRSSLRMAEATYAQAKDGMERLEKVYATGSVPEVKMVEMRTNLSKAEAAVEAARKAIADCSIKSPIAGVAERVDVVAGQEVAVAEPIVKIVDVSTVSIHFPLPENEFNKVAAGCVATVSVPALGSVFEATVTNKAVVASQLSHSYDCTLGKFPGVKGLVPGMVCKITISSEGTSSVVVPSSAVMTDTEGRYVWTVEDGTVCKRHIKVGGYEGNGIVVSEGLPLGTSVVIEGARKVSTGMNVNTVE